LHVFLLAAALSISTGALDFQGAPFSWRYTCYNVREPSPPLAWSGAPDGTQSFALLLEAPERPDGIGVQWLVFNVPADAVGLPEDVPKIGRLDTGALQGLNDQGRAGYSAPCPPIGSPFVYRFTLFALDGSLDLGPEATAAMLRGAATGHVLDQAQISGTYLRPAWPWG